MNNQLNWNISNRGIIDRINNQLTKNQLNIIFSNISEVDIIKIIKALKNSKHTFTKLIYSLESIYIEKFFLSITNKDISNYIKILLSDDKLFSYVLNNVSKNLQKRLVNKINNKEKREYWKNILYEQKKYNEPISSREEIYSHQINDKMEYIKKLNEEIRKKEKSLNQLTIQKEEHINLLEIKLVELEQKRNNLDKEVHEIYTALQNQRKKYNDEILLLKEEHKEEIENEKNNFNIEKERYKMQIKKLEELKTNLSQEINKLKQEKDSQIAKNVRLKIPEYVNNTINSLIKQENDFNKKAKNWNIIGILALIISIIISLVSFGYSLNLISTTNIDWKLYIFLLFKGLIVISIFIIFARYAFNVASSFTHESLKRNERIHAITFGKLFLEIYGKEVTQNELKDIFSNWTIDSQSAFIKNKNTLDEPKILEYFKELSKVLQQK